jgi:hypothetical protein
MEDQITEDEHHHRRRRHSKELTKPSFTPSKTPLRHNPDVYVLQNSDRYEDTNVYYDSPDAGPIHLVRGISISGPVPSNHVRNNCTYFVAPEGLLMNVFRHAGIYYQLLKHSVIKLDQEDVLCQYLRIIGLKSGVLVYSTPESARVGTMFAPGMHRVTLLLDSCEEQTIPFIIDRPNSIVSRGNVDRARAQHLLTHENQPLWSMHGGQFKCIHPLNFYQRNNNIKTITFEDALRKMARAKTHDSAMDLLNTYKNNFGSKQREFDCIHDMMQLE